MHPQLEKATVTTKAETGAMQPQTKARRQSPKAGRESPSEPLEEPGPPHTLASAQRVWFQVSGLQNCERTNLRCLQPPSWW